MARFQNYLLQEPIGGHVDIVVDDLVPCSVCPCRADDPVTHTAYPAEDEVYGVLIEKALAKHFGGRLTAGVSSEQRGYGSLYAMDDIRTLSVLNVAPRDTGTAAQPSHSGVQTYSPGASDGDLDDRVSWTPSLSAAHSGRCAAIYAYLMTKSTTATVRIVKNLVKHYDFLHLDSSTGSILLVFACSC